jgi:hypothetical protein
MRYRPTCTTELPLERVHDVGDYADNVTSEQHVDSSDQLAIHLHLSYIPIPLDAFAAGQCSENTHFSHHSSLVSNCHERYALPLSRMTDSLPTSSGIPGEACKLARTYSVGELLTMRDKLPFVICNVDKLNPKITSGMNLLFSLLPLGLTLNLDVIKVPEDARLNLKRNACSSRNLSSTARKITSRSSHTPGLSRDSEISRFQMKNGPWSPEDQEDVILFRGSLALQSHDQKQMWMLRKRGSSDRSGQPFPAPSGFEAQKADNFRKFYAAVISPTHLRVTAGGRIVPNTRGVPHPTFVWNTEKQFFESTDHTFGPALERQKSWLQGTNLNAADPHSPLGIVRPAVEDFFGPPLHLHSSTRFAAPTERNGVQSQAAVTPDAIEEIGTEHIVPPCEGDTTATQGQVKISPPSQFDVFRPFFINGQPFYPAPPGIQAPANIPVLPFNMLGNHNTSSQSFVPPYQMIQSAPLQIPAGNLGYPQQLTIDSQQMGQQIPLMHTSGFQSSMLVPQLHAPVGQPFGKVSMMPVTSLPDEPVTMHPQVILMVNQIQALQQQLRHLENQLQNNKHQIDEQHVIQQQDHVQNQIKALQSGLNIQVFPPALLPHEQYGLSMWNIGLGAMSVPLAPITNSRVVAGRADAPETTHVYVNGYQTSTHDNTKLKNTDAAAGTQVPLIGDSQGSQPSARPVQTSRKRLSAAAAMAPEFQPRSQLTIANQSGATKTELPITTASGDFTVLKHSVPQKSAESQLLSNVTQWSTPGQWANSALMLGPAAIPNGHTMHHLTKGNPFIHSSAHFQKSLPINVSAATGQEISPAANCVDPYLMGYPPPGMPANSIESADMIYSRELTREELQARQMYWGKAPLALSKGLPKFDGKDFYAPSPEKTSVGPKEHHSHTKNRSFQHLNTSSTIPEPSSPKIIRNKVTLSSRRGSKDSQGLFQSTDDIEHPIYEAVADDGNSSPENDTASLDAWGMAKTDEEEIFDRPAYQTSSFNNRVSTFNGSDSVKSKLSVPR